jgi:3-hydroxymyristoyl/3-hydroxydecanoyl-(acyl carrier protein) dehydratase
VPLPHRFPFRFVIVRQEREGQENSAARVSVQWTGSAWWSRGQALPRVMGLEVLAQASLAFFADRRHGQPNERRAESASESPAEPFLAGVDGIEFLRDIVPGDRLEIDVALDGSMGQIQRLRAELRDRSGPAIRGSLLVGS